LVDWPYAPARRAGKIRGVSEIGASEALRQKYGVPDGIRLRVEAGEVLAWLPDHEAAVRHVAANPRDLPRSPYAGRAPLARLAEGDLPPLLVRTYRKGGVLRHVRGASFRGRLRPLEELVLLWRLGAAGVPVLDAVGAVVLRGRSGWRGFLLTREVPGSLDLEAWLHGMPAPATEVAPAEILRRAGRSVRALHDAGVSHADLHPKNLLITPSGAVLVLDLDRAETTENRLDDERRLANFVRLGRAVEKHRLKGLTIGRREALRFLEGYAGDRAAAGTWLARIRQRLVLGLVVRRAWWRLTGEARPWQPGRLAEPTAGEAGP
jgi:hypothetical protein